MTTLPLRQRLIDIAMRDVNQIETSRNQGPAIKKFWTATNYQEGYKNREPYCSAAVCYWVREWLKDKEVLAALGMTDYGAEVWRCKSARAFDWLDWAKRKGVRVLSDSPKEVLHTGDVVVYDISHVGIVRDDYADKVATIEANTGTGSDRDGDGIFLRVRPRSMARAFIRLMP